MTIFRAPTPEAILAGLTSKEKIVEGHKVDCYTIGELAKALGRQVVTVRKWEVEGRIPLAPIVDPGMDGRHGRRRYYTAAHIVGMVRIAAEEGILLDPFSPRRGQRMSQISETKFTERVFVLFEDLLKASAA